MDKEIGRLAMRQEGGTWVAYYALPNTMDGALFLGSVKMSIIIGHPDRKQFFMDMMKDAVTDIIEEKTGERVGWKGEVTAPEHERSGSS